MPVNSERGTCRRFGSWSSGVTFPTKNRSDLNMGIGLIVAIDADADAAARPATR